MGQGLLGKKSFYTLHDGVGSLGQDWMLNRCLINTWRFTDRYFQKQDLM